MPGCQLLGGWFALSVQISLATLCIGTLVIKRQNEVPRRDWTVWAMDVMKQSIGSSFSHFSNIFASELIAAALAAVEADECQWYSLSFVLDSTLGTFVNLSILHLIESYTRSRPSLSYLKFGDYGNPPNIISWGAQLLIWLVVVVLGKIVCISILLNFAGPLNRFIVFVFQGVHSHPEIELIVVMIIIPMIFNVASFWITDTFLKHTAPEHSPISVIDADDDMMDGSSTEGPTASSSSSKSLEEGTSILHSKCMEPLDYQVFSRASHHRNHAPTTSSTISHGDVQLSPLFPSTKLSPRSLAEIDSGSNLVSLPNHRSWTVEHNK
jgi:hypothetical protein